MYLLINFLRVNIRIRSIAILLVLFFASSLTNAQKLKGSRILGWQVDVAENGNYADSAWAYSTCIESAHILVNWSSMEKDSGVMGDTFIAEILGAMNFFYPLAGSKVDLQFAPINTTQKEVPLDLKSEAFNSPKMIRRGKAIIDTLFKYIPKVELSALSIGNEIDVFLGANAQAYSNYKEFLDSIVPHAKSVYLDLHGEELKIGATFTHHGLINSVTSSFCKTVNSSMDYIITTYYPLNSDFTMKDPSVVFPDFEDLINEYNGWSQPIYFAECGYSSGNLCNSSEQKQAQFYKEVFRTWDSFSAEIEFISLFKTTDWSLNDVQKYRAYYNIDNDTFIEYLRTLGVRTWQGNGTNKLAWEQINCELEARNWCSWASCNITSNAKLESSVSFLHYNRFANDITVVNCSKPVSFKIYNTSGVFIKSSVKKINTFALPKGVYLVEVEGIKEHVIYEKIAIY